jgi:hypothetical protein
MYAIIEVNENLAESTEQLGSKEKFWFIDRELGRCLFKLTRPLTGEDWSEKIAAECAGRLQLPCARYELAQSQRGRGVVTQSFVPKRGTLIHGNELLLTAVPGYGRGASNYRVSEHTIDLVFNVIDDDAINLPLQWQPPEGISRPVEVFVGYLLLDALVGNTDRHHENWGLIDYVDPITQVQSRHLAPTYDHASSLGRNELEENIQKRLTGKDRGYSVEKYAEKCRSSLFLEATDAKPLTTHDAFRYAAKKQQHAAKLWLSRLEGLSERVINQMFVDIPTDRISPAASEFAQALIRFNKEKMLDMAGS